MQHADNTQSEHQKLVSLHRENGPRPRVQKRREGHDPWLPDALTMQISPTIDMQPVTAHMATADDQTQCGTVKRPLKLPEDAKPAQMLDNSDQLFLQFAAALNSPEPFYPNSFITSDAKIAPATKKFKALAVDVPFKGSPGRAEQVSRVG